MISCSGHKKLGQRVNRLNQSDLIYLQVMFVASMKGTHEHFESLEREVNALRRDKLQVKNN